jgi:hypothetical protein
MHTPAPWYLTGTSDGCHAHLQSTIKEEDGYIAYVDIYDEEQRINAKLLREAPIMFELLCQILENEVISATVHQDIDTTLKRITES